VTRGRGERAGCCPPAVLAPDALDRLHRAGLELLESVGVQVRDDAALAALAGAGAARPYTRAHHRDVWSSPLFDTSGFEAWAADGSRTLEDRLHEAALGLAARCVPVLADETAALIDDLALRRA
jgi:trimethylamine:corrinoid methyltransferase-like protein